MTEKKGIISEMVDMNERELFYEADIRKHQQIVAERMLLVAQNLINRAINHDSSKLEEPERSAYVDPVYLLHHEDVLYGSPRYKELIGMMGEGWDHHRFHNDHHIEFFVPFSVQTLNDPVRCMDLFALFEMLCDWIAASERRDNDPCLPLKQIKEKYGLDEQLEAILRNTTGMIRRLK